MKMTKSDVLVEELEPVWCECDQLATHCVMVDLRAIGLSIEVEPYCQHCALQRAEQIRASLPDDDRPGVYDETSKRFVLADDQEELLDVDDQRVTITEAGRRALESVGNARCRVCGCTDEDCSGCVARTGAPCHWFEPDLCSACADGAIE